ncbi:MAG: hypothetical protein Q8S84_05810 [bacterium]|nr:hypothetical protein [bacterium]MDP3380996.1 hypothetical protein [bacterium]
MAVLKNSPEIIVFQSIFDLSFTCTFTQFKYVHFHFSHISSLSIYGSYNTHAIGSHLYTNAKENVEIGNQQEKGIVQSIGSHTHK